MAPVGRLQAWHLQASVRVCSTATNFTNKILRLHRLQDLQPQATNYSAYSA